MSNLTKTISRFRYEDMCSTGTNVLPISSVCDAKCLFCSNKMNPFPIYRCGFRPLAEVEEFLISNGPVIAPTVEMRLSDALPGRISEGEATLHPHFFEICKMVRKQLPNNPLHITTNGGKLTEEFIDRMREFAPFNVWLSYHSTNVDAWTKIFGLSEKKHEIATKAFRLLKEAAMGYVCAAIVVLPNTVGGWSDVEKTMMFFNEWADEVQYWEPGYSKLASEEQKELMYVDAQELHDFTYRMYKQCDNLTINWSTDIKRPLSVETYNIMHELMHARTKYRKVMWLTAEINYERLKDKVAYDSQFTSNEHYVQTVVNHTYGGNIRCNGLLMMNDMLKAVRESEYTPDIIVAPSLMLDRQGKDLTEVSSSHLSSLGIPIWWR